MRFSASATLLGLGAQGTQCLWRIDPDHPDKATDLLAPGQPYLLSSIAAGPSGIYIADFQKGLLLRLQDDGSLSTGFDGLRNPNVITTGRDGTLYVGEFVDGSVVKRMLP